MADGEARVTATHAHDLRCEKLNRKRDDRVERQRGRVGKPVCGDAERDAVGERERRDRLQQHHRTRHDQEQAKHEEQVIDTEGDVLDAQPGICPDALDDTAGSADNGGGRVRVDEVGFLETVRVVDLHEDGG